jgi:hypothetical protein
MDLDLLERNSTSDEELRTFRNHLFYLITKPTLDVLDDDCKELQTFCIHANRRTRLQRPATRRVDSTFMAKHEVTSSMLSLAKAREALGKYVDLSQECLALAVVTGHLDCKYWIRRDGLVHDIASVMPLDNKPIRSAVRGVDPGWNVEAWRMPQNNTEFSKEFGEVLAFLCTPSAMAHVVKAQENQLLRACNAHIHRCPSVDILPDAFVVFGRLHTPYGPVS